MQSQLPDITTASLIECQQEQCTYELTNSPLTNIKEYIALIGSDCFTQHAQPALYLQDIQSRRQRRALAQLRTGSHWLAVKLGRWTPHIPRAERTCQRCSSGQLDDLAHMVFSCTAMDATSAKHASFYSASRHLQGFFQQNDRWLASFAYNCSLVGSRQT